MKGNLKRLVGLALAVAMLFSMSVVSYAGESMSDADEIRLNGRVSDNLVEYNEKDYYYFELDEAGYVTIGFEHDNFTEERRSWTIVLYDEESEEIYSFDSYQNKPKTTSCELGLAEGVYYIMVKSASYHHDGDYTIKLNYTESRNWESEFNDTIIKADEIKVNDEYSGTVRNYNDKDYYEFSLRENGVITIDFKHDNFTEERRSWTIRLFDEESEEIYSFDSYQNKPKTSSCNIGLGSGTYYILVEDASYHHEGKYDLKVNYLNDGIWETEINDSILQATPVNLNTPIKGSIKNYNDKDYFKVNIPESGYYVVDFLHEDYTESRRSWEIDFYDGTSNTIGDMDSYQNQVSARIRAGYVESGTYYVCVQDASYHCDKDYTLIISKANQKTIKMQINNPVFTNEGKSQNIDSTGTVPVVIDGRTLVPIRAIIEGMGGKVDWDGNTQKVTLTYYSDKMELTLGKTRAYLNGSSKTLDVAPRTINDRTMLPIRFISENFGCDVEWDGSTQTVTIKY